MQVVAFALEERMLLDVKHNIQVTRRTAELSNFAGAAKADTSSVLDSGRDFSVDAALAEQPAFAFTLRAGIGDHAARALARGTGAGDAEEPLLVANLAAAIAGAARRRPFAGSGSRAPAVLTGFMAADGDARLGSEVRFFEFECQIFA